MDNKNNTTDIIDRTSADNENTIPSTIRALPEPSRKNNEHNMISSDDDNADNAPQNHDEHNTSSSSLPDATDITPSALNAPTEDQHPQDTLATMTMEPTIITNSSAHHGDAKSPSTASTIIKTLLWYLIAGAIISNIIGIALGLSLWRRSHGDSGFTITSTGFSFDPNMVALATAITLIVMNIIGLTTLLFPYARRFIQTHQEGHLYKTGHLLKTTIIGITTAIGFFLALQIAGFALKTIGVTIDSSDTSKQIGFMITAHEPTVLGWFTAITLVFCTCILSPIVEETIYRGIIGRALIDSNFLTDHKTGLAVTSRRTPIQNLAICLISGLFFGLPHLQPSAIILMTILGALHTWLTSIKTRNLTLSITAHIAYNTIGMAILLLTI